jgi:hypothetical protein
LRYEDTVIGLREDKLIERRHSRNLLDSDLKPNPNWPLTEQVSSEVHAIEVREHKFGQIKGFAIRHPKRIIHRALSFWGVEFCPSSRRAGLRRVNLVKTPFSRKFGQ